MKSLKLGRLNKYGKIGSGSKSLSLPKPKTKTMSSGQESHFTTGAVKGFGS